MLLVEHPVYILHAFGAQLDDFNALGAESTAFVGQSAPRKAVDLGHLSPDSVFYNLHSNIHTYQKMQELSRREKHGKFKMGKSCESIYRLLGLSGLLAKYTITDFIWLPFFPCSMSETFPNLIGKYLHGPLTIRRSSRSRSWKNNIII